MWRLRSSGPGLPRLRGVQPDRLPKLRGGQPCRSGRECKRPHLPRAPRACSNAAGGGGGGRLRLRLLPRGCCRRRQGVQLQVNKPVFRFSIFPGTRKICVHSLFGLGVLDGRSGVAVEARRHRKPADVVLSLAAHAFHVRVCAAASAEWTPASPAFGRTTAGRCPRGVHFRARRRRIQPDPSKSPPSSSSATGKQHALAGAAESSCGRRLGTPCSHGNCGNTPATRHVGSLPGASTEEQHIVGLPPWSCHRTLGSDVQ